MKRVYDIGDLPQTYSENLRLTPTSTYVLKHSQVQLKQLFPKYPYNNLDEQRRLTKLSILIELRQKLLLSHKQSLAERLKQKREEGHHLPPRSSTHAKNKVKSQATTKHTGFLSPDRVAIPKSPKNFTKPKSKIKQPSNNNNQDPHQPLQQAKSQDNLLTLTDRDRQHYYEQRKSRSIKQLGPEEKEAQLMHSQYVIMKIEEERQKERLRQMELNKVSGREFKRLEKIHMLERLEAQRQIQIFKNTSYRHFQP